MKRELCLITILIFIVSLLPLSIAEDAEDTSANSDANTVEKSPERLKDGVATTPANTPRKDGLKEKLKEAGDRRIVKLKELSKKPDWAKYDKALGYKARILDKVDVEKARESFLRAKEKLVVAKVSLERARLKFQEKLELRKNACKGQDKCNLTDEELIPGAKDFLGNSADAIIAHLNKLKTKIQENDDLSEAEVTAVLSKIDAKIAEVQAAKVKAEAAKTKEEVREAAKTINAAWKNIKLVSNLYLNQIAHARIGGIIIKSEKLREKLDRILARMEENGKDASSIKPLVAEFDASLKLSKEKYEAALAKFKEFWAAEGKPEAKDKLEEAQGLMKEAKAALKEANEKLRGIIKAVKEKNGEKEIEEENEDKETQVSVVSSSETGDESQTIGQ